MNLCPPSGQSRVLVAGIISWGVEGRAGGKREGKGPDGGIWGGAWKMAGVRWKQGWEGGEVEKLLLPSARPPDPLPQCQRREASEDPPW